MKTTVTLLCQFVCIIANTQPLYLFPGDTIPKPDSFIQELKNDVQESLPVITLDADEPDNEGGSISVSSVLSSGNNPFLSAAAFSFSPMRFRLRGYNGADAIYLNGADLTGADNGLIPFSLWSGLTNVLRARENAYGLEAAGFSLGGTGLNTNIDLRAGAQWAQTQVGYATANRNYRHRFFITHGSGFNKKGWAYSFMLNGRYANEGYVPGTYYRGFSYYAAVDKKLNPKNTVSLITFGAPTESGPQAASVQEAMDLAGTDFYNPSWGYQDGKKRNANVAAVFQPVFMAVHEYQPNRRSSWMTTLAYASGKRKTSGFDWYNAPDPRPDYYRYLPGYYAAAQPSTAATIRQMMLDDPELLQVNWEQLYNVNRGNAATVHNVDGIPGNDVTGYRSLYILSDRVNALQRFIINTIYNTKLNQRIGFSAGAHFQNQVNHYYEEIKDLLGGDFWVNVNQFAERDYPNDPNSLQFDVDHPNQIKKAGDQYGYDYKMIVTRMGAWAQVLVMLNHMDLFAGAALDYTRFYRNGLNRNGLFPDASLGKSAPQQFLNPGIKAGITYKLNGRNYFFINGGYFARPPLFDNVFISPRMRNTLQGNDLKSETVRSVEGGYKLNSPSVHIGLTGYYTQIKNVYDVMTFYHDQYQNFVNYALSGINSVYFGGELGASVQLTATLSFNGAVAAGRYYYQGRPDAVVTVDNSAQVITEQTVYLDHFRVPSTPQNAYSAGLFYRSSKYWFISLTGNYFDNSWLSVNPLRRTVAGIGDVDPANPDIQSIISTMITQEKFPAQFSMDLFGGWSRRLPRSFNIHKKPSYLVFSVGINNLLNNQNIRSGGFEQLRFDAENRDVNKFPPKYYYAYGLNYYASVLFRFH